MIGSRSFSANSFANRFANFLAVNSISGLWFYSAFYWREISWEEWFGSRLGHSRICLKSPPFHVAALKALILNVHPLQTHFRSFFTTPPKIQTSQDILRRFCLTMNLWDVICLLLWVITINDGGYIEWLARRFYSCAECGQRIFFPWHREVLTNEIIAL